MVVLVVGANGQLGTALKSIAGKHPEINFVFTSSSDLDITDKHSIQAVFAKEKPDFCINAAAYTAVDKAEIEKEKAYDINVNGVRNLAETCRDYNVTLLHVSTDFVFDGNKNIPYTEEDTTNPKSIYGQTKLEGEEVIKQVLRHYFIIRTSWLYSDFGNNFMKTMLRLARERDALSVVNDQIGTPTHAVDLAEALIKIITSGKKEYGIYHFSNEGIASWYDFAKKIFEINSVTIDLQPIPSSQFPTPASRPKYSVLDKTKIKTVFGMEIQKWEEALRYYMFNR